MQYTRFFPLRFEKKRERRGREGLLTIISAEETVAKWDRAEAFPICQELVLLPSSDLNREEREVAVVTCGCAKRTEEEVHLRPAVKGTVGGQRGKNRQHLSP